MQSKLSFCLALSFLAGCRHAPVTAEPASVRHFVSACGIYSTEGIPIRVFRGGRCLFFEDGSYILGDSNSLSFVDKLGLVVWKKPMHTHHILTKTRDGNFLVGTSEIHRIRNGETRFDVLQMFNQQGKVLHEFSYYNHLAEILKIEQGDQSLFGQIFGWDRDSTIEAKLEWTHMNSYYEIPENSLSKEIPAFAQGNIVVNISAPERILILDPTLQKILWYAKFPDSEINPLLAHDVQILPNGNLIVYNNFNLNPAPSFSAIQEFDPRNFKIVWQFVDSPPENFYSATCGGVQVLKNGNILFSDHTHFQARIREVTRAGKVVRITSFPSMGVGPESFHGPQDVKEAELSNFLLNNQSP